MTKRKETRTTVAFAIRRKSEGTRTEYKLHNFDGEAEDLNILVDHENIKTLSSEECLKIVQDAGFLCSSIEIALVVEKEVSPQ